MKTKKKEGLGKKKVLSNKQYGELCAFVEHHARERKKCLSKLDIADFFAGAMAAMFFLDMVPPPNWVFGIMRGDEDMVMGERSKQ